MSIEDPPYRHRAEFGGFRVAPRPLDAPSDWLQRLNRWFDSLPRSHTRLGERIVPVYFAMGLAGVVTGTLLCLFLCALVGASAALTLATIVTACAAFVAAGLLRRRTGTETHVLLTNMYVVLFTTGLLLWSSDYPVWRSLDLLLVGLAVTLAFGRVGCLVGGCCFGKPAAWGICYPPECHHRSPPIRRFPVQLLEAVFWGTAAVLASVLVLRSTPGTALGTVLVGYGITRLFLELLRGDPRPRRRGLTESHWLCVAGIGVGLHLVEPLDRSSWPAAAVGVALVVALVTTRRRWLSFPPGLDHAHRDALRRTGASLVRGLMTQTTTMESVQGYRLFAALSEDSGAHQLEISISRTHQSLHRAEAELVMASVVEGATNGMQRESMLVALPNGVFLTKIPGMLQPPPYDAAPPPRPSTDDVTSDDAEDEVESPPSGYFQSGGEDL
ncbi:MAG: prolipoprotein diacylglyceryl transferase [Deltaproteobacteria bacterium]|nr:prolipoprotein diacylglyceryl transferase [Deltaproteobacteria bacterium]